MMSCQYLSHQKPQWQLSTQSNQWGSHTWKVSIWGKHNYCNGHNWSQCLQLLLNPSEWNVYIPASSNNWHLTTADLLGCIFEAFTFQTKMSATDQPCQQAKNSCHVSKTMYMIPRLKPQANWLMTLEKTTSISRQATGSSWTRQKSTTPHQSHIISHSNGLMSSLPNVVLASKQDWLHFQFCSPCFFLRSHVMKSWTEQLPACSTSKVRVSKGAARS